MDITRNKNHRAIDVFSGCGGLTEGLKTAGFSVVAAIENDPFAALNYRLNHSEVELICEDIRNVTTSDILSIVNIKKGELDLLAGCPPCQGFSTLRTRNGKIIDDPRNNLIDEMSRLTKGLYPKVVLLENVPSVLKYKKFKSFIMYIKKLGYTINITVLDASSYGVPQRRKRAVVIASRIGEIDFPTPCDSMVTVRETFKVLKNKKFKNDKLHNIIIKRSDRINKIIKSIPKNGGSRCDISQDLLPNCHKKTNGFRDVYGRMKWDDVSPTITSGCINPSKGRFLHPEKNRAITLREAALLQTFPENYKFDLSKGVYNVAKLIGNAFPPKFAMHQLNNIIQKISTKK